MGVSRAQKLKMKHEKITYFRHYVPWTKIPDDKNKFIKWMASLHPHDLLEKTQGLTQCHFQPQNGYSLLESFHFDAMFKFVCLFVCFKGEMEKPGLVYIHMTSRKRPRVWPSIISSHKMGTVCWYHSTLMPGFYYVTITTSIRVDWFIIRTNTENQTTSFNPAK